MWIGKKKINFRQPIKMFRQLENKEIWSVQTPAPFARFGSLWFSSNLMYENIWFVDGYFANLQEWNMFIRETLEKESWSKRRLHRKINAFHYQAEKYSPYPRIIITHLYTSKSTNCLEIWFLFAEFFLELADICWNKLELRWRHRQVENFAVCLICWMCCPKQIFNFSSTSYNAQQRNNVLIFPTRANS